MPHELPAKLDRSLDDLGVDVAHIAVQRGRPADAVPGQHIEKAPDSDAIAIFADRPAAYVGNPGIGGRDPFVVDPGQHVVEVKVLDVRHDPQRKPMAARPREILAPRDRQAAKWSVA
jgi:hypothetical protein